MTGERTFRCCANCGTNIADPERTGKPDVLFKKSPPVRPELLKIDGRLLEVRVRLNPRARRVIVKVNPATGEVSVTAPTRRGLAHALDFARGEKDWIAGQLAKARGCRVVGIAGGPDKCRSVVQELGFDDALDQEHGIGGRAESLRGGLDP